ncbi:MaoC family dehydratase N-terminal domain-containing protein [Paralcaligenes sp. KSB-10]|uniref:FAS1-like dehydratase domain-containing protein n=1 Tax=Paralcaligenes sp. KSB-10 TaxID=2901142 RepID=UPI001E37BD9B|nr:MaoC family dehydratase N-terminal domain-containing protein [Paralcaligenes sp. KSB-10]UHL65781.1 MaoC family dehydratase N-terminal domain-containing protein [Paralcaligenes sp. KSB-10]
MTATDPASWIGRTETCADRIDIGHIEKIALSLDAVAPAPGGELPLLWHWGLFIKAYPYDQLGDDGHPRRGGFLPPAENRNRMWAGGRLEFLSPLRVGMDASRVSTIASVKEKEGRTGKLLFVTVKHEYFQDGLLRISEEQDVVYREPSPPRLAGSESAPAAEWSETIVPSSTVLFRYSAVTYNGHRIHYDEPYATQVEGYPGLVVHGPMIATLMCRAFSRANPGKTVASLSYRGLRPLIAPRPFQVAGSFSGAGVARLWAEQDGTLAHQAELRVKT